MVPYLDLLLAFFFIFLYSCISLCLSLCLSLTLSLPLFHSFFLSLPPFLVLSIPLSLSLTQLSFLSLSPSLSPSLSLPRLPLYLSFCLSLSAYKKPHYRSDHTVTHWPDPDASFLSQLRVSNSQDLGRKQIRPPRPTCVLTRLVVLRLQYLTRAIIQCTMIMR